MALRKVQMRSHIALEAMKEKLFDQLEYELLSALFRLLSRRH